MSIKVDEVLDAQGLACPMPIIRTKKMIENLTAGQVLEVQATDKGSLADIQGWARSTGHEYLGTKQGGDLLKHYIRKANPDEIKPEKIYPHTIQNEELLNKLDQKEVTVIDVREPAEYSFGHIPMAISIPFGELEDHLNEINQESELYVICRTGKRSDLAAQLLSEKGFDNVLNVLPGMSEWQGPVEKNE